MRNPKEYLNETFRETGYDDFDKIQMKMLLHCIKSAQKEAYNQAIHDILEEQVSIGDGVGVFTESILKLKIK